MSPALTVYITRYLATCRRSELTSLRLEDLTQCGDGQSLILLLQSKTDQTREGALLVPDIETTYAVTKWIDLSGITDGFLIRGITGKQLNQSMNPG